MTTIQELIHKIRLRGLQRLKNKTHAKNSKEYVSAWLEKDVLIPGKVENVLVVILRTHGCSWARSEMGGCAMCGYINDCLSQDSKITTEDIIIQFSKAMNKFQNKKFQFVKIFTSGSFIDDNEVSKAAQKRILEMCNELSLENVLFESRPEFVTHEKLGELTKIFNGKLQVAIGLESANNKILKFAINKGFEFEDYCKAAKIAHALDIKIKTYLLLKPPFLTERDAISDALNSINLLKKHTATDIISINPINIQKFTLVEHLFTRSEYRPPWLWSVVEILNQGAELLDGKNIRLLSQPTAAGLRKGAHNCGSCDKEVISAINDFSLSGNTEVLQNPNLDCTCKEKWRDTLELENMAKSILFKFPD